MVGPNAARELERIARYVEGGRLTLPEALERAYALGAECERLDLMHAACAAYSAARAERERRWALEGAENYSATV
jgi:hypothetical protein